MVEQLTSTLGSGNVFSFANVTSDCVMAIWGAPEPVTNSQFHACQAAMEFNQALEILNMGLPKSMPKVYRVKFSK